MKFALILLLATIAADIHAAPSIPAIASIAGMRVGYDTMEALDQRLGPALVSVGGHPRGRHDWQSRQTGWDLSTDGFYYSRRGRVIDSVSIFVDDSPELPPYSPKTNLPRRQMLFMGTVSVGMKRTAVLRLLRKKLPPPQAQGDLLIWEAQGVYRFNAVNHYEFKIWTAKLNFSHNRLTYIDIDAHQSL